MATPNEYRTLAHGRISAYIQRCERAHTEGTAAGQAERVARADCQINDARSLLAALDTIDDAALWQHAEVNVRMAVSPLHVFNLIDILVTSTTGQAILARHHIDADQAERWFNQAEMMLGLL